MSGPHPAVAATRVAVRAILPEPGRVVLAAVSGGPDSLALAAALAVEAPRMGVLPGAVVVDHDLRTGSREVAERAGAVCRALGLDPVDIERVAVATEGAGGPQARARTARLAALEAAAARRDAVAVLLGHTRDDQAEQVLLGISRGSGSRSLAGMAPARGVFVRPFLHLDRATTTAACSAQGLQPWSDPANDDDRYARVRARRALDDLEATLGPGLRSALARTAALLRDDADALDAIAAAARADLGSGPWDVVRLASHPPAVRRRLWLLLVREAGARDVRASHLHDLDALVTRWRGQGPVDLPGGVVARSLPPESSSDRSRRIGIDPATRGDGDVSLLAQPHDDG